MSSSSQAVGGHGHRSWPPLVTRALTALLLAATVVSGCTVVGSGGSGGAGAGEGDTTLCGTAFAVAAAIDPALASDADLDVAIKRCRSLDEWGDAAADHPEALRGTSAERLLADRCSDPAAGLKGYQLCGLLRATHATPTPKPTPRPTPRPTKAPPWPVRSWDAFREHFYRVESKGINLVYQAADGIQGSTFRSRKPAIAGMEALRTWATNELRWLDRHLPATCYAIVHRTWRKGISYVAQATRLLVPAFRAGDTSKAERGAFLLQQASDWFNKADARFDKLGPNGCDTAPTDASANS